LSETKTPGTKGENKVRSRVWARTAAGELKRMHTKNVMRRITFNGALETLNRRGPDLRACPFPLSKVQKGEKKLTKATLRRNRPGKPAR